MARQLRRLNGPRLPPGKAGAVIRAAPRARNCVGDIGPGGVGRTERGDAGDGGVIAPEQIFRGAGERRQRGAQRVDQLAIDVARQLVAEVV
jgi:hypothetical protein